MYTCVWAWQGLRWCRCVQSQLCTHRCIYIQIKESLNEPIQTDKLASLLSLVLLQAILSLCIYKVASAVSVCKAVGRV